MPKAHDGQPLLSIWTTVNGQGQSMEMQEQDMFLEQYSLVTEATKAPVAGITQGKCLITHTRTHKHTALALATNW